MTISSLTNQFLKTYFSFFPVAASSQGYAGFDGLYGDYSDKRLKMFCGELRQILQNLTQVSISENETVDCELLKRKIKHVLFQVETLKSHTKNPADALSEASDGLWVLMMQTHRSEANKLKCIGERLASLPDFFKQAQNNLNEPVKLWKEIALQDYTGFIDYLKNVIAPYLKQKSVLGADELIKAGVRAIESFASFLKKLKKENKNFAIGEKNFSFILQNFHGYKETAYELFKLGLSQMDFLKEELEKLSHTIKPGVHWVELVASLKKDVPKNSDLVKVYEEKVAEIKKFLIDKNLITLPSHESLRVIETPSFLQSSIPYAAYSAPTMFAEDSTGSFFVSPTHGDLELLEEHAVHAFPLTALHEAYPGHHLQFSIQRTLESPIRKIYDVASYYEGWTLYCEEMMGEVGFYTAEMKLFQLKDRLWRACRMVVDVSMQCFGMSDVEAVDFLVEHAKLSHAGARADVNWYTQSPTIPLSYLAGALKVKNLQKSFLQKGHTLKEFHDSFLSFGAIPLDLLDKNF